MTEKKAKTLKITMKEAKLALKGVGELPYSEEGCELCDKLERFINE